MSKWNLAAMGQAGLTGWTGAVSGCGDALWVRDGRGADEQRWSPGR